MNGVIVRSGWFKSAGGSTGGDIDTGLSQCYLVLLQPHAASAGASQAVVNEAAADVSVAGFTGTVTIVTIANQVGKWIAYGN
jgi:hypothetical protein